MGLEIIERMASSKATRSTRSFAQGQALAETDDKSATSAPNALRVANDRIFEIWPHQLISSSTWLKDRALSSKAICSV